MRLFVDMHVLQSVPPSCLNRDDTGSPKTAVYGGARRARVSSQSWKRAMRLMFQEYFDESELGFRTKHVLDLVVKEILKKAPDYGQEAAETKAKAVLEKAGIKLSKKKEKEAEALFFISAQQARNLADVALDNIDDKEIKKALKEGNSVDLALFGRMVASDPSINCDATAQVAHAISTHKVENEYDFFTAVDDRAADVEQDHAGGGHLGTVEFNSSTLYRFATVMIYNTNAKGEALGLYKELSKSPEALEKAVREFVRAFICAIPTGKQNTFAAHTVPSAVLVTIRTDRPLNLVGAFEKPISGEGLAESSAKALEDYAKMAYDDFCTSPAQSYVVGQYLTELGERLPLEEMLTRVSKEVVEHVNNATESVS